MGVTMKIATRALLSRRLHFRHGFTLIEILVVIAILSLLAAILFPVFARARENSRRASCQSNLKQLMLGLTQYVQDFDERYPPGFGQDYDGTRHISWGERMEPHVKSTQIFSCPSASWKNGSGGKDPVDPIGAPPSYPYYTYRYFFNEHNSRILTADIRNPSLLITLGESGDSREQKGSIQDLGEAYAFGASGMMLATSWPGSYSGPKAGSTRHFEGANFAYADGHVKWLKRDTYVPTTAGVYWFGTEEHYRMWLYDRP